MKKKRIYNLILLFLIILIQSTRYDFFSVFGLKPDFIFLFICMIGLRQGCISGTIFGFLGGAIQDLFSNSLTGSAAFAKSLWGYLIGKSTQRFDINSLLVQLGIVFTFTIFNGLLIFLLNWIFRFPYAFYGDNVIYYILGEGVYNCALWPFFYHGLTRLERLLFKV